LASVGFYGIFGLWKAEDSEADHVHGDLLKSQRPFFGVRQPLYQEVHIEKVHPINTFLYQLFFDPHPVCCQLYPGTKGVTGSILPSSESSVSTVIVAF
jgi:hypothetical protein